MVDGAMSKPLHDLVGVAFLCWVVGAMVLGWLNNRGRRGRWGEASDGGVDGDDGPHHGAWWGFGDADGGHDGDAGGDGH